MTATAAWGGGEARPGRAWGAPERDGGGCWRRRWPWRHRPARRPGRGEEDGGAPRRGRGAARAAGACSGPRGPVRWETATANGGMRRGSGEADRTCPAGGILSGREERERVRVSPVNFGGEHLFIDRGS